MGETTCDLSRRLENDRIVKAMAAACAFLDGHSEADLFSRVGRRIDGFEPISPIDKRALQDSYGGSAEGPPDDFLAGRGMFYVTEQGRLYLDCTSGHYQMLWGYQDPGLNRAVSEALAAGVVWDNHCNVPQSPVKRLAKRLVAVANGGRSTAAELDTVLLGCATGSVACAAAMKIQLKYFEQRRPGSVPVFLTLEGNYHGTDMFAQFLRGMWPRYFANVRVVLLPPNDVAALRTAFEAHGEDVAGFWAEPIMMNREAVPLDSGYLQAARDGCDRAHALMCIDEIQTGFWQPEVFAFRTMGIVPDLVIVGKGMAAGVHPQSAVIYKRRFDVLEQYDAISTNGTASLACYVGLYSLERIAAEQGRISSVGDRYLSGLHALADEFPGLLADVRGKRHLAGLKFRQVADALDFHRRATDAGLWLRVHAYHAGHSTVLTKLPLIVDEPTVDFIVERLRALLSGRG